MRILFKSSLSFLLASLVITSSFSQSKKKLLVKSWIKRESYTLPDNTKVGDTLEGYNVTKATTFIASFIVKKDGSVDSVQIIKGITDGFNAEVIRQLKKTSRDWTPAVYRRLPIQTQMFYTIKYLDSIVK